MKHEIAQELAGLSEFLIIRKAHPNENDGLLLYHLSSTTVKTIADIPMGGHKFALIPYNQIATRGYDCIKDDAKTIIFDVHEKTYLSDFYKWKVDSGPIATKLDFEDQEQEYSLLVERVIKNEIGKGECSNVVISRTANASTEKERLSFAVTLFKRLLTLESGAYWMFLLFTKDIALIGASPEVHVKRENGVASMVAISGTERIDRSVADAINKLSQSKKDRDELLIVLDEEIKILSEIGSERPRIVGPHFRVMSHLVHSEFNLSVACTADFREVIEKTLFAPTVVGGPLKNAAAVISRNERTPRGYYSGTLVEIEFNDAEVFIDSCILIRTLFLDEAKKISSRVGSTITAKSVGAIEANESNTKLEAIRRALSTGLNEKPSSIPRVSTRQVGEIVSKAPKTAKKWYGTDGSPHEEEAIFKELCDKRIEIVDYEDRFTYMWAKLLESYGVVPTVTNWIDFNFDSVSRSRDIVIFGPGPGNPLDFRDERVATAYAHIASAIAGGVPMIAVCLSHQLFCQHLGFSIRQRKIPNQGTQRTVDWNGRKELVGFYNSFEAVRPKVSEGNFQIFSNDDGSIDSVYTKNAVSIQFHAESVFSVNGDKMIAEMFSHLSCS